MPGSFFDTNILIYAASQDTHKAGRAQHLIAEGGAISVQVLNELANVARRKLHLSWSDTNALLATVKAVLQVRPVTVEIHETGMLLAQKFQLSIYDAVIVAAALDADCDTLWSEDMQDGMLFEQRLTIKNPFQDRA